MVRPTDHETVDHRSSVAAKIALFRSLFRGREDVYPRRFESRKTGKAGYQPACSNEWVRGVCEKPRIKCSECPHQRFQSVTDETIRWHLCGHDDEGKDFVMGIYPMLLDETCLVLAVDLDKGGWQDDAKAILNRCRELNVPAALERSRSGNGAHVWLFFAEAVPASLARKLGSHLLTEAMERRPEIGLRAYDRLFPNQDTLPRGGFGNLIALPLQRQPREFGNSLFLDEDMQPYVDQWAFLATVRKMEREAVAAIVHEAEGKDRVIAVRHALADKDEELAPWTMPPSRRRKELPLAGPRPKELTIVLGDEIYISKDDLSPELRNRLTRLAAFQNPGFYKAQAMRLPTYDKPRIVACAGDHPSHISLPRGCLNDVQALLSDLRISCAVRDERLPGRPLPIRFRGKLHPEQLIAANAILPHDIGVLSAGTAFGKTVIAAWLIAERGVNTLVLVHRRQLLEQWVERLSSFLDLPPASIGSIGGGRKKPTGMIDVAVIQSLVRKGQVDDVVAGYGHLVVDECHHLSAYSFEQVARRARAKYVTGLSATLTRSDGHHPIIFMQCGPVRYRIDARRQAAARPFGHTVVVRPTGFRPLNASHPDARIQFHQLCEELIADEPRNRAICDDVIRTVRQGRSPIVLTERNAHLERLAALLAPAVDHLIVLRGGRGRGELRKTAERLCAVPSEQERVLVATGPYVGEGFDDARLDTLFLTLPVSWRGTVAQYVGRLHRLHDRKLEVQVYDYVDLEVPVLARMFDRRCRGYDAIGYRIVVPASAVPGWPIDVPLPTEPEWKRDYAASVKRLVRDGVDAPLGNLFAAAAARTPRPDADGAERARSATEEFLYRRLQTLPATAGRFRLNAELPIPFDGRGRMEVDLLCADARIAIELDGAQHLDSAQSYRRDRRKDQLLQEAGYFVLRFLAEDVGKDLDLVLDAIQRTLFNRQDCSKKSTQAETILNSVR